MMNASNTESETEANAAHGKDSMVKLAVAATSGVGLVVSLTALLFGGLFVGMSVLVGGVLAVSNLLAFALVSRGILRNSGTGRAMWALAGAFKFVLLLLAVALLLRYKAVSALPMMIGYGALPIGITLSNWLGGLDRREQG